MSTTHSLPENSERSAPAWLQPLLGDKPAIQRATMRLLARVPAYGLALVALLLAALQQRVPSGPALLVCGYIVLGVAVFYTLIRSGRAAPPSDPALAYAQVLFGLGAIWLASATMAESRVLTVQWLCLILVFDLHELSRLQVQRALLLAVLGMSVLLWLDAQAQATSLTVLSLSAKLLMASLTMLFVVVASGMAHRQSKRDAQDQADMVRSLAQLESLAIRDGLTRAYTRGHMMMLLELEAARQKRTRRPFCVAMLDIDFFKKINDRFGHAVGDLVLVDFARIVQEALDDSHSLARWGGEEFLALMPDASTDSAMASLARVRERIHAHDWAQHAEGLAVTFSGGVCLHELGDALMQAIEKADGAVQGAKHAGRDRVLAHAPAHSQQAG